MKKTLLYLLTAMLPLGALAQEHTPQQPTQPNLTVDYLVVFDHTSEELVLQEGGEQKFAEDIVSMMNLALKNSNIDYRFRLAGTYHLPANIGSINSGLSTVMNDPGVQQKRREVKADIVTLISEPVYDGLEGISNHMADRYAAFASVRARSAIGSYTAAHETAHILGCNHSRTASDQSPSQHPWAAAWADSHFSTIVCNPLSGGGKKVPIFSGPESVWVENGVSYVLGDETHDNVRMLRQTLPDAVWFGDFLDDSRYHAAEENIVLDHRAQSHELRIFSGSFFKISAEPASWISPLQEIKTMPMNGFYMQDGVFSFSVEPNLTDQERTTTFRIYGDSDKPDLTVTVTQLPENSQTGITTPAADETGSQQTIYDVSGVRMNQPFGQLPRGIYIVNGQKTIRR